MALRRTLGAEDPRIEPVLDYLVPGGGGVPDGGARETMSTLSLRLPKSLHERARELAQQEGVSINQLIATALAEKISALDTIGYLKGRGARGSREAFLQALEQVPSTEPVSGDELPPGFEPEEK